MPLRAVICDVYNTLFRNETSAWLDTFGSICRLQGLPVSPQELWDVWKSFEMEFRRVRTNLERPEESPPVQDLPNGVDGGVRGRLPKPRHRGGRAAGWGALCGGDGGDESRSTTRCRSWSGQGSAGSCRS